MNITLIYCKYVKLTQPFINFSFFVYMRSTTTSRCYHNFVP